MGIYSLVAEYYVRHRQWPLEKAQLEQQLKVTMAEAKEEMSVEETREGAAFLKHFTMLEFLSHEEDLVLHYRLRVGRKVIERKVRFVPRHTADDILQAVVMDS